MADGEKTNELIDPRTLGESIKAKVKDLFMGAIPDEKWDAMIEGEIKAFFHEQHPMEVREVEVPDRERSYSSYTHMKKVLQLQADVTPFRAQVFEALRPLVSERLQEVLGQEKFAVTIMRSFDPSGVEKTDEATGKFFEDLLRDMAPDIVRLLFTGVFAQAAETAREALRAAGQNVV